MKKLFVSLLAIAGMVACTNDQTLVQRGNAPMEFAGAFVDNATRANVGDAVDPSTTTNSLEGFDVWAFMDEPAGTVFVDEDVTGAQGNFTYANTQYWVPGHVYYFAALAPMNSANWNLNTAAANTDGAGIVDFHNVDGTEDLLYAATSVSTKGMALGAAMEAVKFQFNHLLSKVKFSFTNSFPNENARIDVKNVTMKVPAFASINLAQADWWSTNKWENYSGETTLRFGDACAKTGKGVTQETANECLTIPAGATQSYIVTFDVALYYGDRLAFEKTGITTTIDGVALEIGKSYNFTANLSASNIAGDTKLTSIDFDVEEVKKWDEKTVSLIDSAEKLAKAIEDTEVDHIILDGDIDLNDLLSTGTLSTRAGANAGLVIPADRTLTLDLNGHTIFARDYATAGYALITNKGDLTINGKGTLRITGAENNRGWGAYSSVISNQPGGNLTVNAGVTIEHLGGTDMAYGIDNLTNGKGTSAIVTINGATVESTYRPIRQFLNGVEATNELYVNEGSTVESTGGNKAIWMQDPSKNANTGKLVVAEDAFVHSVYLDVTPGSTEWPVEVSVAASSLTDTSDNKGIYTDGIPAGYEVVNENDVWTVVYTCAAKIGNVEYNTLQAAIEAVQNGETIVLQRDLNITTPAYGQNALNHAKAVNFTLDLNGKTITADTGNSVFRYNISQTDATSDITVTFKNGTITSGDKTWCTVMAAGTSDDVKAIFNLENLTINASKAGDLAIKAWDYAVINATNVTVNATKCAGGFYAVGGEIVLDNCTVNQKGLWTAPYLSMAVAVSNGGKAIVNSGNYTTEPTAASEGYNQGTSHGSWCAGVMNSGGELIINGGTFANDNFGDNSLATAARGLIFGDTASKIVINDGTFNALKTVIDYQNNLGVQPNPNIVINGGNFSANPAVVTSYGGVVLAEGKVAAQGADGRWTLVDGVMDEAGLKAAFEKGGNIVLGADITVSETVTLAEGKTAVLDLKGKKILGGLQTDTSKHIYPFNIYGSLTINDSSANGSIEGRGIYVQTGSKLIVNGGSIYGIDSNGGSAIWQYGGDITINGGLIEQKAEGTYNFAINGLGGTITVTDGKIAGNHGAIATAATEVVLNDGEFVCTGTTGMTDNVLYSYDSGTIIINGGTFTADNDGPAGGCCVYDANGGVTINGGVFGNSSGGDVWGTTGTTIKGGKFENLIETSHIAEGYEMNANGEVVAK